MISQEFPGYSESHEGQETSYKKLKPWFIKHLARAIEERREKKLMEKEHEKNP